MDQANVIITSNVSSFLTINIFDQRCENCLPTKREMLYPHSSKMFTLSTIASKIIKIVSLGSECSIETWLEEFKDYSMTVGVDDNNKLVCGSITYAILPYPSTPVIPPFLLWIITIFLLIYFAPSIISKIYQYCPLRKLFKICSARLQKPLNYRTSDTDKHSQAENLNTQSHESKRLISIDVFRGLTVLLMIFVNSGGGGYWYFKHSIWHGITYADIPHPWFNWIMGLSIVGARSRSKSPGYVTRVFQRSAKLFFAGFMVNSVAYGNDLGSMPFMGVCQDLALAYFIVAMLAPYLTQPQEYLDHHTTSKSFFMKYILEWLPIKELMRFWDISFIMLSCLLIHIIVIFGVSVPGCGRGYLGPGGNHLAGNYSKCTGGAFGYIDRSIMGTRLPKHMIFEYIYNTQVQHDSYGLAEIPTQLVQVYLGMLSGNILILYKTSPYTVLRKWMGTSIILVLLSCCLCNSSYCIIPPNRRLWTVTYILTTSALANFVMAVCYFLTDVKLKYNGKPYIYLGMNSLAIFVGHQCTKHIFPFGWRINQSTHQALLFQHLWQTFLWVLIAMYMFNKKIFIRM